VAEDTRCSGSELGGHGRPVGLLGADQATVGDRALEEGALGQCSPVLEPGRAECPEDRPSGDDDAAVRVPERTGLERGLDYGRSSFFRMCRSSRIRRQKMRPATAAAATPPTMACRSMLPVPGSRYACTDCPITAKPSWNTTRATLADGEGGVPHPLRCGPLAR
jgi:hypothetical protein